MRLSQIKRVLRRTYNKIYELIGNCYVSKNYRVDTDRINVKEVPTDIDFVKEFEYMDETNPDIRNMFSLQNLIGTVDFKYQVVNDNCIEIDAQQNNNENWLAFIVTGIPEQYIIEFDYTQIQPFCEFQIAFNYESLLNRNRFIVMENREILFDDISTGHFFKPLKGKYANPIFKNGVVNHVSVICTRHYYEFVVNEKSIMIVRAKYRFHKGNGVAIVFWENYHNRRIKAKVEQVIIKKVVG